MIVLGSPVGSSEFVQSEISKRISLWCEKLQLFSGIARSQPQSAYSAFNYSWSLWRVVLHLSNMLYRRQLCGTSGKMYEGSIHSICE